MSARSRDPRRFDPVAELFDAMMVDMGNPAPAERIRRTALMQIERKERKL